MNSQYEQHPEQWLLNTDPAVAIDLAIGKELQPGETIEADYDALRNALQAIGAPPDNSHLTIHLRKIHRLTSTQGWYELENREVNSPWMPWNPEKAQRALQHELQHTTDPTLEELSMLQRFSLRANTFSRGFVERTLPLAAAIIGSGTAETFLDTNHPLLEQAKEMTAHPMTIAYMLGCLATISAYYFNKDERNARKAAKIRHDPVFVTRKEKQHATE